ncbi:MAG: carotenoid 1,2-hydratase [bacterium]|jgi:predicted secreted hydrolase|nr:carotenoid 1,2-hydratase [bacterium]
MKIRILIIFILFLLLSGSLYLLVKKNDTREIKSTITIADAMANRSSEGFERAIEKREFRFPHDHGPHPEFQTEWWYFTGNLETDEARHFGFQFTLFRNAISADSIRRTSIWATSQIYMGHFALTDVANKKFYAFERFSRGAAELAGAQSLSVRIWLEDWSIQAISSTSDEAFPAIRIRAKENDISIDLNVATAKPVVLHGDNGLSRKGPEVGNASYYYSLTRLAAEGEIQINNDRFKVNGHAWLDREWSTSALGNEQVGWDWFSLQLEDGREIMYYQIRKKNGEPDIFSSGTVVRQDGSSHHLKLSDVSLQVLNYWKSPSGATYPAEWQLQIPQEKLILKITPFIPNQELDLSIRYWEGAVKVSGISDDKHVSGSAYVELTGYADSKK